ncbi:MAG: hypothetical protein WBL29_02250 [Burkholderiales bacterium]
MYAITRAKKAKNAWYWRVSFKRRGEDYARTFYDLKHGGQKKALAAALAWRDRQLKRSGVLTLREFHAQRRSNNTSGVPGVHFLRSAAQPRGTWQAKIKLPNGRKVTKSFAVMKFGARSAFRRAVAARARMLELVGDQLYLKHPTAMKFATSVRS